MLLSVNPYMSPHVSSSIVNWNKKTDKSLKRSKHLKSLWERTLSIYWAQCLHRFTNLRTQRSLFTAWVNHGDKTQHLRSKLGQAPRLQRWSDVAKSSLTESSSKDSSKNYKSTPHKWSRQAKAKLNSKSLTLARDQYRPLVNHSTKYGLNSNSKRIRCPISPR